MSMVSSDLRKKLLDTESAVGIAPTRPLPEISDQADAILLPPLSASSLGSREFLELFDLKLACVAGSMANGISSVELVSTMAENGCLASFGAAGLSIEKIGEAIQQLQQRLGNKPFAFNLIHSPGDKNLEYETARLYVEKGISVIEISAFLQLTPAVILCRASGLRSASDGQIEVPRQIIAKVSRGEVAEQFLRPAPEIMLDKLVDEGAITEEEAKLASEIPICDALTVESDSGGHTDGQPLMALFPSILSLREKLSISGELQRPVFLGVAGSIGTPASVAAAFAMGADYVMTGSINQACVEAGTSSEVKSMLASAKTTDVSKAPAADMFAMGVQVQVLKQGTLFPMRAQKLYELYREFDSLDDLPDVEVKRLEEQFFRMSLEKAKHCAEEYTRTNHPEALQALLQEPRVMMLRVFLWYMSHSSSWATSGEGDRKLDYQVWCGPAMGAFNAWAAGTPMSLPAGRKVYGISKALMQGAAYLLRLQNMRTLGYSISPELAAYSLDESVVSEAASSITQKPARHPSERKITNVITAAIAEQAGVQQDSIDITLSFNHFDLDSLKAVIVLNRIEKFLGFDLSPTLVWNYPTIRELANHLAKEARKI